MKTSLSVMNDDDSDAYDDDSVRSTDKNYVYTYQ